MSAIDRWRNWHPSTEKFDEYPGCEPPKPPKPTFEGFEGSTSGQMQNFSDLPTEAARMEIEGNERVYRERAERLLRELCRDYEPGVITWLEANAPLIYEALTATLPNRISELWNQHAALKIFDAALAELLETHRRAVAMCRAARKVEPSNLQR